LFKNGKRVNYGFFYSEKSSLELMFFVEVVSVFNMCIFLE